MSGRLQAARLAVLAAAHNLSLVESINQFPWDEDPELDWTPDLGEAHDELDKALAEYVEIYNEENNA